MTSNQINRLRSKVSNSGAKAEVMDWLAFYNVTRPHSKLGYTSPMNFEKSWWEAQQRKSA